MARRLLAALFLACALPAIAGELTWQDANHESAELIRGGGDPVKAADLARTAFDLYATQSPHYTPENHAQLLLNAVDAREKSSGIADALKELDRGAAAIAAKNGGEPPALVALREEGARLAMKDARLKTADRYYGQAVALADKIWGAGDQRAIALQLRWAAALGEENGTAWARTKLEAARELATQAPAATGLLGPIDIALGRLDAQERRFGDALRRYQGAVATLKQSSDPAARLYLQTAYAQLAYTCEQARYWDCAKDARAGLESSLQAEGQSLVPVLRVTPTYPRDAASSRQEGSVTLLVTIGPDGSVTDASVTESQPAGVFDAAALKAIRQWTFKPKVIDGRPVETHGLQRIDFRMDR